MLEYFSFTRLKKKDVSLFLSQEQNFPAPNVIQMVDFLLAFFFILTEKEH